MENIKHILTEILQKATALKEELPFLYQNSGLKNAPDVEVINKLLIKMRKVYYGK